MLQLILNDEYTLNNAVEFYEQHIDGQHNISCVLTNENIDLEDLYNSLNDYINSHEIFSVQVKDEKENIRWQNKNKLYKRIIVSHIINENIEDPRRQDITKVELYRR